MGRVYKGARLSGRDSSAPGCKRTSRVIDSSHRIVYATGLILGRLVLYRACEVNDGVDPGTVDQNRTF
jgi:hypothetical protein